LESLEDRRTIRFLKQPRDSILTKIPKIFFEIFAVFDFLKKQLLDFIENGRIPLTAKAVSSSLKQ